MSTELQRAVGRIEATLDAVAVDVAALKVEVATLVASANVAKGARRATYAIAAAVGGVLGTATSLAVAWLK